MHPITSASLLLLFVVAPVFGQESRDQRTAETSSLLTGSAYSALVSSYYADIESAIATRVTDLATNSALVAVLSTVSGISTKDVAADIASVYDEGADGATSITDPALQYLTNVPSTGAVATLLSTWQEAIYTRATAEYSQLFQPYSTGSQASGVANPTGAVGSSGFVRSTGGVGSSGFARSSGIARSSGAAQSTRSVSTAAPSTTAAASSRAATNSSAAPKPSTSQSTSSSAGGAVAQPTGAVIVAGAAAAGVLGLAAML